VHDGDHDLLGCLEALGSHARLDDGVGDAPRLIEVLRHKCRDRSARSHFGPHGDLRIFAHFFLLSILRFTTLTPGIRARDFCDLAAALIAFSLSIRYSHAPAFTIASNASTGSYSATQLSAHVTPSSFSSTGSTWTLVTTTGIAAAASASAAACAARASAAACSSSAAAAASIAASGS